MKELKPKIVVEELHKSQDDLALVLRGQLYIEAMLRQYLDQKLYDPAFIDNKSFEYSERIKIALSVGLDIKFQRFLNAIGSIRNRFAHDVALILSPNEVNNLYDSLAPDVKKDVQKNFKIHLDDKVFNVSVKRFTDLEERERFIRIIVCMLDWLNNSLPERILDN